MFLNFHKKHKTCIFIYGPQQTAMAGAASIAAGSVVNLRT